MKVWGSKYIRVNPRTKRSNPTYSPILAGDRIVGMCVSGCVSGVTLPVCVKHQVGNETDRPQ